MRDQTTTTIHITLIILVVFLLTLPVSTTALADTNDDGDSVDNDGDCLDLIIIGVGDCNDTNEADNSRGRGDERPPHSPPSPPANPPPVTPPVGPPANDKPDESPTTATDPPTVVTINPSPPTEPPSRSTTDPSTDPSPSRPQTTQYADDRSVETTIQQPPSTESPSTESPSLSRPTTEPITPSNTPPTTLPQTPTDQSQQPIPSPSPPPTDSTTQTTQQTLERTVTTTTTSPSRPTPTPTTPPSTTDTTNQISTPLSTPLSTPPTHTTDSTQTNGHTSNITTDTNKNTNTNVTTNNTPTTPPPTNGAIPPTAIGIGGLSLGAILFFLRRTTVFASERRFIEGLIQKLTHWLTALLIHIWWLIPIGYHRHNDDHPLDHDRRERIYALLKENPHTTITTIAERTNIPRSSVDYHISILARDGLLTSDKPNGQRYYYPTTTEIDAIQQFKGTKTETVLNGIDTHDAPTISDLSDDLNLSRHTISYHVEKLVEADMIEREQSGRSVVLRRH